MRKVTKDSQIQHPSNHPKKGSSIIVEPIKSLKAIKRIKKLREDTPRDLCLFTVGINTGLRAGELLSLTLGDVQHLVAGDALQLKQSKNGEYRRVTVNQAVVDAIDLWLEEHPDPRDAAPLFPSRMTGEALTVSEVRKKIKRWCAEVGLRGNYGSHTMRKTWGYQQRQDRQKKGENILPVLTRAYGHKSEAQTLDYLCIQPEEIEDLYGFQL